MRQVSQKYKDMQKYWWKLQQLWSFLHYSIGLLAAVLAFLASSKELGSFIQDQQIAALLAMTSGLMAVVITFLSPASKKNGYSEACNLLRITRQRYETENAYTEADLNNALQNAQDIISRS